MATEETAREKQREIVRVPNLPDYLVNFVDFKREMVRLDYTSERLRRACQEVEEQRVKMREGLSREADQVTLRQQMHNRKRLEDDQETLRLQIESRQVAERRRVLLSDLQQSRQLLDELARKRAKLQHWLDGLEEHRVFLSEIIAHRVSPRTPSSGSSARKPPVNMLDDNQVVEMMQSPGMIRSRLSHKERNVVAQSRMVFQACQLMGCATCKQNRTKDAAQSVEQFTLDGQTAAAAMMDHLAGANPLGMQSGLGDQIFATVHRLYKRFISPKSSSCDALNNFAALERYAYYVLQMVDACDPAMLKKIISKVVVDKKKTMEQQKMASEAAHREERERKALANALSSPAVFKRVSVVSRKRIKRISAPCKDSSQQEIEVSPIDELSYLFRFQL